MKTKCCDPPWYKYQNKPLKKYGVGLKYNDINCLIDNPLNKTDVTIFGFINPKKGIKTILL